MTSSIICTYFFLSLGLFQSNDFEIAEADIQFTTSRLWEFVGKTGELSNGKVQYYYSHPHVNGETRVINPSIIVTLDKGSWFSNQKEYWLDKKSFHEMMGDTFSKILLPDDPDSPGMYLGEATSGVADNPYGQKMIIGCFWNQDFGFHIQIQTSRKELERDGESYFSILESIRSTKK